MAIGRYFFDFFEEKAAVRGLVRDGSGTYTLVYISDRELPHHSPRRLSYLGHGFLQCRRPCGGDPVSRRHKDDQVAPDLGGWRRHPCGHAPIEAQHNQRRLHLLLRHRQRGKRQAPLREGQPFSHPLRALPRPAALPPRPTQSVFGVPTHGTRKGNCTNGQRSPSRHRGRRPAISYALGIRSCRRFAS